LKKQFKKNYKKKTLAKHKYRTDDHIKSKFKLHQQYQNLLLKINAFKGYIILKRDVNCEELLLN